MSLKRKRDDQLGSMTANVFQPPTSTTSAPDTSGFMVFPAAGQSVGSVFPAGFPTASVPNFSQNSDRVTRLRAPCSTVCVVAQEDVRDIAGFY